MKILVTGGAGFIGSHVTDKYIEEGHDVAVIDNLEEGRKEWVNEKAEFHNIDIRDKERLRNTFKSFNPDLVNHHAASNDSMESLENPAKDAEVNILGGINVLELAKKNDVKKFIYPSSGGLSYGEPQKLPTSESHQIKPSYPYGISKHSFEHYLELNKNLYNLEFIVLRYASVYGKRATGGVIKNFLDSVERGNPPTIFGDGSQTRDFIHVKDIVSANEAAIDKDSGIYNIGTCKETSVNELWSLVKEITGSDKQPQYKDRWTGDIDRCKLDYTKAKNELNWRPTINLREGLKMTTENRC